MEKYNNFINGKWLNSESKETIKVGDEISIFGHPGRDGRKLLSVISIKLPNGTSLGQKYPD